MGVKSGKTEHKNDRRQEKILTANYTFDPLTDKGLTFTNEGQTGSRVLALPAAKADGVDVKAHVKANQVLRLEPDGTDQLPIETGALQTGGLYVQSNVIGDYMHLRPEDGLWRLMGVVGSGWTVES